MREFAGVGVELDSGDVAVVATEQPQGVRLPADPVDDEYVAVKALEGVEFVGCRGVERLEPPVGIDQGGEGDGATVGRPARFRHPACEVGELSRLTP